MRLSNFSPKNLLWYSFFSVHILCLCIVVVNSYTIITKTGCKQTYWGLSDRSIFKGKFIKGDSTLLLRCNSGDVVISSANTRKTSIEKATPSFVIDDKISDITKCLLDENHDKFWSNQLTKEQMGDVKFVIKGWSQITSSHSTTEHGAENIEAILNRLETEKRDGNQEIDINIEFYSVLIDMWAKEGLPERSITALKKLEKLNEMNPESFRLTNVPYNTVIHAWKRSGEGEKAEEVLNMMIDSNVNPDEISYNGVIMAFAKNYKKYGYAADNAERVLKLMINADMNVDTFAFNAVMDAHAKSMTSDSARKAVKLLIEMEKLGETNGIKPNTISYTSVIDAFAKQKSQDSAINAEKVFKKMEAAYNAGNEDARPNRRSFNAVINAYVQSNQPGSALKAEQILLKMLDLSRNDYAEVRPNVITFTTVINGWAKSGESGSGERAQNVYEIALEEYEQGNSEALPNSFLYSALIDAWVKARDKESVSRAYEIYSELYNNFIEGINDVKPSTFLANQVIDAFSRSGKPGAGDRAEELLAMLDNLYTMYKDDEMKPNAQSYTITMNAWAKSRSFGKAKKAEKILLKMEEAYKTGNRDAKPNVFAYTAVLNACAFTVGDLMETKEALQIASRTYRNLCSSGYDKPNSITFATFLRVVLNLIPKGDSQQAAIVSVFNKCREHGQVNDLILDILMNSVSKDRLSKILGNDDEDRIINIHSIPAEWKVNARVTKRDKRRRQ